MSDANALRSRLLAILDDAVPLRLREEIAERILALVAEERAALKLDCDYLRDRLKQIGMAARDVVNCVQGDKESDEAILATLRHVLSNKPQPPKGT